MRRRTQRSKARSKMPAVQRSECSTSARTAAVPLWPHPNMPQGLERRPRQAQGRDRKMPESVSRGALLLLCPGPTPRSRTLVRGGSDVHRGERCPSGETEVAVHTQPPGASTTASAQVSWSRHASIGSANARPNEAGRLNRREHVTEHRPCLRKPRPPRAHGPQDRARRARGGRGIWPLSARRPRPTG